jgi:hypothetical protein
VGDGTLLSSRSLGVNAFARLVFAFELFFVIGPLQTRQYAIQQKGMWLLPTCHVISHITLFSSKTGTLCTLSFFRTRTKMMAFGFRVVGCLLPLATFAAAGCTDGGNGGCSPPIGDKWDTWSMRASTYTYCYGGCVVDWFMENSDQLGLLPYAGVVGVDHYWTHQGMPCIDGKPQEFALQDALAQRWKAKFPEVRVLQYRILSAVPVDMVVQNKINSDHDSVVR